MEQSPCCNNLVIKFAKKGGETMKLDTQKLLLGMANACMTITELAEKANVSRPALTRLATGKSNPKPATLGKIARALGVKVEDLIERGE